MHWSQVRKQTRLEGGYLDLLEEELPNIPNHPELATNRFYRGSIVEIVWKEDGPLLKVVEVTEYDPKLSIWHSQTTSEGKMEVDLRRPGVMKPQVMKDGTIEVVTLQGFSVIIYPAGTPIPGSPRQTSVALKDVLKIAGLLN